MKSRIAEQIKIAAGVDFSQIEIESWIEKPKFSTMGDFAFPCFRLAKEFKKAPNLIAAEIAQTFKLKEVERTEAVGGYLNFYLDLPLYSAKVLKEVIDKRAGYGQKDLGKGKSISIDLSSPNIAKPFSMGHLRSTVIGNALANVTEKLGYKVIRINHIGDWGTQFGKLITAYQKWGSEEQVKTSPIAELHKLYVYFHEQAELNPSLDDEARVWFKRLEDGDEEAVRLWEWFRKVSLEAFSAVYEKLNISFDSFNGEAFYNDKMNDVIAMLEDEGLIEESEGARVVRLDDEGLPPCLIQKRDGATLYATRDLAAAFYRKREYSFEKSLYVVGNEQSLHFKQLKAILKKLNILWAEDLVHISFGMMLKDGKKMSTRKGKIVLLEKVLEQSTALAAEAIEEKNPNLKEKQQVAEAVGIGAIMFHDLKVFRQNDVHFELKDMLRFEGETGPYVQYAHARACSILRKAAVKDSSFSNSKVAPASFGEEERAIVMKISAFEEVIEEAFAEWDPSKIAKYAIDLAQLFNQYYAHTHILNELDEEVKAQRLLLLESITIVLKESLRLLGIQAPEEM
ncbi:arginyl-tRNA synthetase [Jeotgalibacillus campisalis]|uniref:Arginine--tRNA ligase n=2 Tax=Jeotgalibacillus campisalis TaxID=220754 RepID=A0A0C2W897_9BACL|nr:arginine--tRNA ligase [Jeotgalibacillus campisalis]KIL52816.1 arginyl-tRNA synthetase [Jeotgalibacillus campisalis]